MNKRSQSAMEYLMTYGWAILVVLIALGALFYLGVFSPKTPATCIATAPITCTDVKVVAGGTATLVLGASGTSAASVDVITLTSPAAGTCDPAPGDAISTATPTAISCDAGAFTANTKFAGTATITYTLQGSTIPHTQTVQVSGTVEA